MRGGRSDLTKEELYKAVKNLVDSNTNHIHLPQQKLFTLYSISFNYLMFQSTKDPGHYVIRVEDASLAEKLSKRAKDDTSRKFLQSLMIPRKLKFGQSTFHLDYFHVGTWARTSELPKDKIRGALIIKNSVVHPMIEIDPDGSDPHLENPLIFYSTLREFCPRTITIGSSGDFPGTEKISFDFIKDEDERPISGVRFNSDVQFDDE